MPIQWSPDLALGVPELDGQHLQLDAHLSVLHDALCEGRLPDVAAVLRGVREVSTRHFECEERFMAVNRYAGLDRHVLQHRHFGERLAGFEEALRRDGATMKLAMDVGNWLAGWVREHQRFDLELRRYVGDQPARGGG